MTVEDVTAAAAQRVAAVYRDAELRILERIVRALAVDLQVADWDRRSLARLQRLRGEAVSQLFRANAEAATAILEELQRAYNRGQVDTLADIGRQLRGVEVASLQQRPAVAALVTELVGGVQEVGQRMLRAQDDVYRQIIGDVVASNVAGGQARRQAAQEAVNRFLGKGLARIPDSAGRSWGVGEYVDMATRTGAARAMVRGHEVALDAAGLDLVIVQPGPRACSICDDWARAILSRRGAPGTYTVQNLAGDGTVQVTVKDTLDNARAHGWQHPNCRCTMRAFIPGATKPSTIQRPPWDETGYEQQQVQRSLEKRVRDLKRTEALQLDPVAKAKAHARRVAAQEQLRQHVAEHDYLKRRYDREQPARIRR